MAATRHYPIRPKSDLTLLYGLAHLVLRGGGIDRAFIARHTTGFEAFESFVADFTPERVAAATGLDTVSLGDFARTLIEGRPRVSF